MLAKDIVNKAFCTCLHPVSAEVNGIKRLVPCRKCAACENHRKDTLSAQLRAETSTFQFCYLLTLTYSEEFVPRFIVNHNFNDSSTPFDDGLSNEPDLCSISFEPIQSCERIWSDIERGLYKLPSVDNSDKYRLVSVLKSLDEYSTRRALYNSFHPTRKPYDTQVIDTLYILDIQRFIKRLRKYIYSHFHEKVRIYCICEYGTESLRPHYHVLLFFNSADLSAELSDEIIVQRKKQQNGLFKEYKSAKCLLPLWKYGTITSCKTDGNAYGYVSNYVTGSSLLPSLFTKFFKPKALHSIRLGASFLKNYVETAIRQKNWSKLDNVFYTDKSGFIVPLTIPRSYIDRFFPSLGDSCIPSADCTRQIYECCSPKLRFELGKIAKLFGYKVDSQGFCSTQLEAFLLYREFCKTYIYGIRPSSIYVSRAIDVLDHILRRCQILSLSPLTRVLYASKHYLSTAHHFGWSLDEMYKNFVSYHSYSSLKLLKNVFSYCERSNTFTDLYYSSVSVLATDKQDSVLNRFVDYRDWRYHEIVKSHDNIKHAQLASLYSGF